MDPRLRAAVDASMRWYDDVFALHGIPFRVDDGLWWALGEPPPFHSAVKTLEPGIAVDRVLRAASGFEHCAVADSFGDLDLGRLDFDLLIDATWLHREPPGGGSGCLPEEWSVLASEEALTEWSVAHDYVGVLPAVVLGHDRFRILACRRDSELVGGAVTHDGGGDAVGLSNIWGTGATTGSDGLLAAVAALHPGRAVTDYANGAERNAMVRLGFTAVAPQRVWLRSPP